jgi:hypothetical protein
LLVTVNSTGTSTSSLVQRTRSAAPAKPTNDLLASLPQSDAIALLKVHRLLDEALPKILAENPAKLAEVNGEIEKFKTKTGIDARQFDQVALGMRYKYPREGITKVDTVALARGSFNAAAFVAAGRIAANGKYREEKYRGQSIYIFTLEQQLKVFGLFNLPLHDLAVTALENNLLALGSPASVRGVIDTGKAPRAANAELIALASRDPNALVGFGGNVTPALLQNLKLSNEAIVKDVSTIRQVYGTVGLSEKDLQMFLAARTTNVESAKSLSDTLEGLKQLGAIFVGRLPAPKETVARTALDNLKITTQGNELQIRTAVAQATLGPLMRGL